MNTKTDRINSELKKNISEIIQRELKDPRITGFPSVISAETTNDLSLSKIYVSFIGGNAGESIEALNRSAGYIRNLLKPKMRIRNMPELKFFLDTSAEHSIKISAILNNLK